MDSFVYERLVYCLYRRRGRAVEHIVEAAPVSPIDLG